MSYTSEYTDNFDRENNTNIGSSWTETSGGLSIISNTLMADTLASGAAEAVYNTDNSSADSYIKIKITAFGAFPAFYVRSDLAQANGYVFVVRTTTCDFYRKVSGTFQAIATNQAYLGSQTLANGDSIYCTAVTTDASTITLSIYKSDGTTLLKSVTDTNASRITAAGRGGVRLTDTTAEKVDDFESGIIGASAPSVQLSKVGGVAIASIGKYSGIAKASIAKVGGKTIQ